MDEPTDDLFWMMIQAMEESFIDSFAERLLRFMKYTKKGIYVTTRKAFQIGSEQKSAQTDVCILSDTGILLLVKTRMNDSRAEAQLVAESIAAYQSNMKRTDDLMVIPGIVMIGTYPIFYKIPVTPSLNNAICSLTYPEEVTVVEKFEPRVPRTRYIEGMLRLDSRLVIARCFEAFREYVFLPFSDRFL